MARSSKAGKAIVFRRQLQGLALHREAKHVPPNVLRFAQAAALRLVVQVRSLRRLSPAKAAMGAASIQRDINHGERQAIRHRAIPRNRPN